MSALLQVSGLCSGYGQVKVLQDVDLTVPVGSIVAVLGANGAGKTTLLRTLSGLVRPTAGQITYDGQDLRGVPVEKLVQRGIAHVPEGRGVVAELTVDENLRLGGLWRKDRADDARALAEVYEFFEPLARRRTYHGHQLSGGERQMLAVGRAPRTAALALAGLTAPLVLVNLPRREDRVALPAEKAERRQRLIRALAFTAGAVLVGADYEGRPGLRWRIADAHDRRVAAHASED